MKRFVNLFLTGLVAILPISITIFIVYKLFMFIDSFSSSFVKGVLGLNIIGGGFVFTIMFITMVGLITKLVLGQKIMGLIDKIAFKIPIIKTIYSSIKDISKMFSKNKKSTFSKVVMVDFPNEYMKSIGFITNSNMKIYDENKVAVFIPTTPNPTNGFLVYVNEDRVKYMDISIDEAIKMIVSMGTVSPKNIK